MVKVRKKRKIELTLRDMYKLADAGGQQYYYFLHNIMGQSSLCSSNKDRFIQWAEQVLKKKLKDE